MPPRCVVAEIDCPTILGIAHQKKLYTNGNSQPVRQQASISSMYQGWSFLWSRHLVLMARSLSLRSSVQVSCPAQVCCEDLIGMRMCSGLTSNHQFHIESLKIMTFPKLRLPEISMARSCLEIRDESRPLWISHNYIRFERTVNW